MKTLWFKVLLFWMICIQVQAVEGSELWEKAGFSSQLKEHIQFSSDTENKIGYLSIPKDRPIDQSTYLYVKFALEEYVKQEVRFVILHLNTPGGEVLSSLKIVDLLHQIDKVHHIPVIAFIDNWAVSAGAMLAYSSRFIAITPNSLMGAAEPVIMAGEGKMESASEKINSALRAEMSNLASYFNRNVALAQAMVDKELIVVKRGGQFFIIDGEDEIKKTDEIVSPKGKLLTLTAKQLKEYGVADFEVPDTFSNSQEEMLSTYDFMQSPLAKEPFLGSIPNAKVISYNNWKVQFFSFLSHPLISSLLVLGMIVGFYIEFNTPGFGLFGGIGAACLALVLLNSFATKTVYYLEPILFFSGIALLCVELFVLPSFGVVGILGGILTLIGIITLVTPHLPNVSTLSWGENISLFSSYLLERGTYFFLAIILATIVILLLSRFLIGRTKWSQKLILTTTQESPALATEVEVKEGGKGVAYSSLRPAGKILVDGIIYDATTEGTYIAKGEKIIIKSSKGSKIVVKLL